MRPLDWIVAVGCAALVALAPAARAQVSATNLAKEAGGNLASAKADLDALIGDIGAPATTPCAGAVYACNLGARVAHLESLLAGTLSVELTGSTAFYPSPSGNVDSALVADPGGAMTGGAAYSNATGCAVYKTSQGALFSYTGLIQLPDSGTYWLLILDAAIAPTNGATIAQGSQPGGSGIGLIESPIPITSGARFASTPALFQTYTGNGLIACVSKGANPYVFGIPSPSLTSFSLIAKHL